MNPSHVQFRRERTPVSSISHDQYALLAASHDCVTTPDMVLASFNSGDFVHFRKQSMPQITVAPQSIG